MSTWEYSYGGTSFLSYIDGNGNEALVNIGAITRVYKAEPDDYVIINADGQSIICNESVETLKMRMRTGE